MCRKARFDPLCLGKLGDTSIKFVIRTRNEFTNIANRLQFGDKPLQVTVKPFQRDRSLDQNAKVHSMIREMAGFTGHSEAQMKDILKAELGPTVPLKVGSRKLWAPKPTSEYTVAEMSQFVEDIYRIGAEVGHVWQES